MAARGRMDGRPRPPPAPTATADRIARTASTSTCRQTCSGVYDARHPAAGLQRRPARSPSAPIPPTPRTRPIPSTYDDSLRPPTTPRRSASGSNNWAVAGSRTSTGRPILASDPHRAYATPSLRYIAHLSAPGLDVIGAGEPALPGVTLGHNGSVAFGFTIFLIDTQDLYVYDLDPPTRPGTAIGDGWEAMTDRCTRAFGVRGEASRVNSTLRSPATARSSTSTAYATRPMPYAPPGPSPAPPPISAASATCAPERVRSSPPRSPAGGAPARTTSTPTSRATSAGRRPAWCRGGPAGTACCPSPATAATSGTASTRAEEFPHVVNPAEGFVATANEFNLPDGLPRRAAAVVRVARPGRHQRIVEVPELRRRAHARETRCGCRTTGSRSPRATCGAAGQAADRRPDDLGRADPAEGLGRRGVGRLSRRCALRGLVVAAPDARFRPRRPSPRRTGGRRQRRSLGPAGRTAQPRAVVRFGGRRSGATSCSSPPCARRMSRRNACWARTRLLAVG